MNSVPIEIREVVNASDLKTFISVPWSVYRDDPNWVPPLKIERKEAFSAKNPYFLHARWKAWVAYRAGQPVGRISAQIDELYLQRHDAHTGFFGSKHRTTHWFLTRCSTRRKDGSVSRA